MTVKELVGYLSKYPEDTSVSIYQEFPKLIMSLPVGYITSTLDDPEPGEDREFDQVILVPLNHTNLWHRAKKIAQAKASLRGAQIRYDEGDSEIYVSEYEIMQEMKTLQCTQY